MAAQSKKQGVMHSATATTTATTAWQPRQKSIKRRPNATQHRKFVEMPQLPRVTQTNKEDGSGAARGGSTRATIIAWAAEEGRRHHGGGIVDKPGGGPLGRPQGGFWCVSWYT